jgi:hypothetical protein
VNTLQAMMKKHGKGDTKTLQSYLDGFSPFAVYYTSLVSFDSFFLSSSSGAGCS